jgi:hypothetical protein
VNAITAVDTQPTAGLASLSPADHTGCGSRYDAVWAVAQTHPQAERWALQNLTRQGYAAYLPLTVAFRRDRATPTLRHRVSVPLWAGYLFVQPGTHWAPICSTHGVSRLLMAGPQPHMLANALVEAVRDAFRGRLGPRAASRVGHSPDTQASSSQ